MMSYLTPAPTYRITVVVPCCNGAKTLKRCVESIISDAQIEKEIIIVENGSEDNSFAIAESIAAEYPGLVRILQLSKKNANAARNLGIQSATGDYIQFLDCDDQLTSNKLYDSVELFRQNPDLIAVYSDGEVNCLETNKSHKISACHKNINAILSGKFFEFTCGLNTNMPIWNIKYIRNKNLLWSEELDCWQESEFYFRILLSIGSELKFKYIPECHFIRHSNRKGISSFRNTERYLLGQNQAIDMIYAQCRSAGKDNEALHAQWVGFKWDLFKRAVVGDCPLVARLVAPIIRSDGRQINRKLLSIVPIPILCLIYKWRTKIYRGKR